MPKTTKHHKSKEDLKILAEKVVDILRPEGLPIWQIKEVLRYAAEIVDWEPLMKKTATEVTVSSD